jgi:hypothetical protein
VQQRADHKIAAKQKLARLAKDLVLRVWSLRRNIKVPRSSVLIGFKFQSRTYILLAVSEVNKMCFELVSCMMWHDVIPLITQTR